MLGVYLASFLLFASFVGLAVFAKQKLPLLLAYPVKEEGNSLKEHIGKFAGMVRESKAFHKVSSPDVLLQNVLSKTRIAAMKTESKTGELLESMRKKSKDKAPTFSDDYWKKLKGKE